MASLSGQNPSETFPSLIKTLNNNPISASLIQLSDGNGISFPMKISTTTVQITGSITSAQTASLAQTASYIAIQATASYSISSSLAQTASYATNAVSSSRAISAANADLATTASYIITAQTASYVNLAQTASFVVNAQTASYVLNAISSSNSTSASYSSTSSLAVNALNAISASYALTASYALNSTPINTSSFVTNAQTSSMSVASASYALTASYALIASGAFSAGIAEFSDIATSSSYADFALTASYALNGGGNPLSVTNGSTTINNVEQLAINGIIGEPSTGIAAVVINELSNGVNSIEFDADSALTLTEYGVIRNPLGTDEAVNIVGSGGGFAQLQWTTTTGASEANPDSTTEPKNWIYVDGNAVQIETNINSTGSSNAWIFGTNGTLQIPGNATANDLDDIYSANSVSIRGEGQSTSLGWYNPTAVEGDTVSSYVYLSSNGVVLQTISTQGGNPDVKNWEFTPNGDLTIPGTMYGTASYTENSISASYAATAGYATVANAATNSLTSNYATQAASAYTADSASRATSAANADTADYAISASYADFALLAQVASSSLSASYAATADSAISASYAATADYAISASYAPADYTVGFALTSSNIFYGSQIITGSLYISENLVVQGSSSIQYLSQSTLNIGTNLITVNTQNPSARFGGLAAIDSGSLPQVSGSFLFDSINDEWVFVHQSLSGSAVTSSVMVTGPQTYDNVGNETLLTANRLTKARNGSHLYDSNILDTGTLVSIDSNTQITGSLAVSNGIVGNLTGTATTASYVQTAQTASYVLNAVSASYITLAQTASYITLAQTASYVSSAVSASRAASALSASYSSTASYIQNAQTASYITLAQTASYVLNATSASYASSIDSTITASYAINSIFADNAVNSLLATTASYSLTASYVQQAKSASYATYAANMPTIRITELLDNVQATSTVGQNFVPEWQCAYTSSAGSTLMFNLSISAYATSAGSKAFSLFVDGVNVANTSFYFVQTNVHMTIPCLFNVENLTAGPHTIQIQIPAGVVVDTADNAHLTVLETQTTSGALLDGIPSGTVSGSAQIAQLGFATTGSNVFSGSQTITGSLNVNGGITGSLSGTAATASYVSNSLTPTYLTVGKPTTQAIPSNILTTVIDWDTPTYSLNASGWNSSLGTFTATRAGVFSINAMLTFSSSADPLNSEYDMAIMKNTTPIVLTRYFAEYTGSFAKPTMVASTVIDLAVNDVISIAAFQFTVSGSSRNTYPQGGTNLTIQQLPTIIQ